MFNLLRKIFNRRNRLASQKNYYRRFLTFNLPKEKVPGMRSLWLFRGVILVGLCMGLLATGWGSVGVAVGDERKDGGEIPLARSRTVPASIRQDMPKGVQTRFYGTCKVDGARYSLHLYGKKVKKEDYEEWESGLDVYVFTTKGGKRVCRIPLELTLDRYGPTFDKTDDGQEVELLWLEPERKKGPILAFTQMSRYVGVVVFPTGFPGKVYQGEWESPESGSYSYDYALGGPDKRGFITLEVDYLEEGMEKSKRISRHWNGKTFEDEN